MIDRNATLGWILSAVALVLAFAGGAAGQPLEVDAPSVVLTGVPFDVTIRGAAADSPPTVRCGETIRTAAIQDDGTYVASGLSAAASGPVAIDVDPGNGRRVTASTRAIPGWISVVPPLLAIIVALLARNVIPALFLGLWAGAMAVNGFSPAGVFTGLLDTFQVYALQAVADADHAAILLFSLMIGGMVGIITKNGGMRGVVGWIAPLARTPSRGQTATGVLGILVFFDDYANVLVVGGTMRRVTDRLRISREKLAYIIDSTAAPVSCLAFVTTWIGFEVGLIDAAVAQIDGFDEAAYSIFLNSIPYSFYPMLAILLVFLVAVSGRDFGPMLRAERRARTTGQLTAPGAQIDEDAAAGGHDQDQDPDQDHDKPARALNAVLPVVVLVATVLGGLYVTGRALDETGQPVVGQTLRDIIGNADSYKSLMWGSLLSVVTAAALTVSQRILTLSATVTAWYAGLKSMLFAVVILIMAWSLSSLTEVLHTAPYLTSVLGDAISPALVPAIVFVLAAGMAFATGTSWGTMGILMPLVVPLAWAVLQSRGMGDVAHHHVLYSTVACTLAGAVWGDHCSPISDTTILSSMASGCDHVDHVRTQLPYAALAGAAALLAGTIPSGFGVPWWLGLTVGAGVVYAVLRWRGRRVEDT